MSSMLSTTVKKLVQPAKLAAAVLLLASAVSLAIPNTSAYLQWLAPNLIIFALWLISSSSTNTSSAQSSYPDIYVDLSVISSLYAAEPDVDNYYTPENSPTTDELVDKSVVKKEELLKILEVEEEDIKPASAKVADDDDDSMEATWMAIMQRIGRTPEIRLTTDKLVDKSVVKEDQELPKILEAEEEDIKPDANAADDDDESMEATWKAIMQRTGRPAVRKTETWGCEERRRLEIVAAEKASSQKAMRKSVSTRKETGGGGGGGWRKREVLVGENDELLRRAESMIRRHHENLRLQRQESEQRRLGELRGRTGNTTNTYVPVSV